MLERRRLSSALALVLAAAACSGNARRADVVPTLPRDGDAHTAKPGPMPEDTGPDDPWAERDDLIAAPAAMAPSAVTLPAIERFTLPNGLQVIVVPDARLPVVSMQLAVNAGRRDVTRDKVGLAEFAAAMLTKGTRTLSAQQIAERIDRTGGTLSANASFEATVVNCSALVDHLRTCATLLGDVAVNPVFPASEMDLVRGQLQAGVQQRKDDAGALAAAHLQNLLWGDENVRGWPTSLATLAAIQRDDLRAWHKAWFAPENAILVVAGQIDAKTARAELQKTQLRWWEKHKVPAHTTYPEPNLGGIKIRLVDKPGQTQTHIRVAQLGVAHTAPDFVDNLVWNYVLGGGAFSSRLMRVIRSEAGNTYSVNSSFERTMDRGSFVIATFTRNPSTLATLDLILRELGAMKQGGPTAEEVAGAVSYLTGSYVTGFESAADIGGAILAAELHGLGQDYVRDFPLAVAKVTAASSAAAAAKTLTPKTLAIVLVGDAKDIKPQLESVNLAFEVVDYQAPVAAYERAPVVVAGPPDVASQDDARKVIEAAVAAKGGAAKLRAVKTMIVRAKGKITVQGRDLPASFARYFENPDRLRMDIELDVGGVQARVITVLDRDKAWNQQPGQDPQTLPDEAVEAFRKQLWRDHEFVLLHALDKDTQLQSLGKQTIDGQVCDVVTATRADNQVSAVLYLDAKTHLLSHLTYSEQGVQGRESYSDYRAVKGIQVAHRRETDSPEARLEVTVDTVSFDIEIKDTVFQVP